MEHVFIEYVVITLIILALVMLANKIKVAYPIVLVIGGLFLSFTSQFSNIRIEPDYVFFIFLPPLLYEASWQVSWKELWKWRRVVTSFAFPIVIITSCAVALFSYWVIPGFTLALGFLLGGIISPPDAVSATNIMRQTNAPKSLVTILEGESLLNDASSLIVFRFALAAIITGQFHLQEASLNFLLVIVMGILIGLAAAYVFYAIHRWLPTTPSIDTVITLVTPYCMYYFAERYHFSGVLAVVSGGLLLSSKRHEMLTYQSRLQGMNVWTNLVFVLNGLVFMLIGLQLPGITSQLGEIGIGKSIGYGLAISFALIASRFLCTFGAMIWTVFISKFMAVADARPSWRLPLVAGWAGMRGVVSLGAALSIPLFLPSGEPFPHRNLILFITFVVILVTLVFQGLTLPWLIRKVKLKPRVGTIPIEEQESLVQKKMASASLDYLKKKYPDANRNEYLNNLQLRLNIDVQNFSGVSDNGTGRELREFQDVYLEVLELRRKMLREMNLKREIDEEVIRKYQALIDLEEFKIREQTSVYGE